jgi:hypothetical protein
VRVRRTGAERGRARHPGAYPAAVQRHSPGRSAHVTEGSHLRPGRHGAARPRPTAPGPAASGHTPSRLIRPNVVFRPAAPVQIGPITG